MAFNHIKISFCILFYVSSAFFLRARPLKVYEKISSKETGTPLTNAKITPLTDDYLTEPGWLATTYKINTLGERFGTVAVVTGVRANYCVPQFGPNMTYIAYSYRYDCFGGEQLSRQFKNLFHLFCSDDSVQLTMFSDTHCTPGQINYQAVYPLAVLLNTMVQQAKIKWPDTTSSLSCVLQNRVPIPAGVHFATN